MIIKCSLPSLFLLSISKSTSSRYRALFSPQERISNQSNLSFLCLISYSQVLLLKYLYSNWGTHCIHTIALCSCSIQILKGTWNLSSNNSTTVFQSLSSSLASSNINCLSLTEDFSFSIKSSIKVSISLKYEIHKSFLNSFVSLNLSINLSHFESISSEKIFSALVHAMILSLISLSFGLIFNALMDSSNSEVNIL
jgi:hypothetical protein